jgi:hypothetical protein
MIEETLRRAARPILNRFPRANAALASRYDALCAPPATRELDHRELAEARAEAERKETALNEIRGTLGRMAAEFQHARYQWNRWRWRYFSVAAELWGAPDWPPKSVTEMPLELKDGYTMHGRVPIAAEPCDGTMPRNYPLIYTDAEIDHMLARLAAKKCSIYGAIDEWLWEALDKYPVAEQSVVVMGSMTAWYEATCIRFGGHPTTIDYNPIITRSARLKTMTVAEYEAAPVVFDAAVSISSFEHDGLGQYGDPLDPDADLKTMRRMKSVVRPGGLMFLAVPIGADEMRWNGKRVYGHLRLPLLLEGWETLDRYGFWDGILVSNGHTQPILVLKNS